MGVVLLSIGASSAIAPLALGNVHRADASVRQHGISADVPPSNSSPLVAYHRSGGFLGLDDQLTIASDGLTIHTTRDGAQNTFTLPKSYLSELTAALEAADFPSLKRVYRPPFPVSDDFNYTLTYRGITVVVFDGAIPPALQAPIAVLDRLLNGAAA